MDIEIGRNKGGRGKANPWKSITVRIPEPCLEDVERIKQVFMASETAPLFAEDKPLAFPSKEETIEQALKILKQKKGAKESLSKLLTFLYGETIQL